MLFLVSTSMFVRGSCVGACVLMLGVDHCWCWNDIVVGCGDVVLLMVATSMVFVVAVAVGAVALSEI